MKILFAILLSCLQAVAFAQMISGTVSDAENGMPLSGVTIYISNSSRATTTGTNGKFSIEGFNSSYDLVFSLVGYKVVSIASDKLGHNPLEIKLYAKENALDPVAVQSYEKDGWNKWGRIFLETFIGDLPFSNQCIIKNKDAIKFRYSKKNNQLEAIALEPLIIVNGYLGYNIRYDLELYQNNFNSNYIFFAGYPVFSNISESVHYQKVRSKRREEVYISSMLHFMRALYSDSLVQEGFEIRRMKKIPNLAKRRADSIFKANIYTSIQPNGTKTIMSKIDETFPRDSVNLFKALMRQPDILAILDNRFLNAKDLFVSTDTLGKTFKIDDYLYITYPSKLELPEYYTGKMGINGDSCVTSVISLIDDKTFQVFYNGQYSPPTNILTEQYWSWSEKMSSMLPFDYKPQGKK